MEISFPVIIINFKTYPEATGEKAIELAEIIKNVRESENVEILAAVQSSDIYRVKKNVNLPVLAQHIDPVKPGRNTGFFTVLAAKKAGAIGTIINHSEHPLNLKEIRFLISECRKEELLSCVCAGTLEECLSLTAFKPDIIAYEPPELISGPSSVSKSKPATLKKSVKIIKNVNRLIHVVCGAGIKSQEDVEEAIKLGAEGVLISSGVVKAKNPKKALQDLVEGLKKGLKRV